MPKELTEEQQLWIFEHSQELSITEMAEKYDKRKKDELFTNAMALFAEAMHRTRSNSSDAGAVFTVCLAMCMEECHDEEDVREILHVVARNCLTIWREYRELRVRYRMGD